METLSEQAYFTDSQRHMFSHFTESEIRPRLSIKGILQSPLADCSLDGVVSNCTGLNLFITPGMLNQQQQATDISVLKPFKDHMRRDCESWFVRNLLWTPADKIKKAPASNLSSAGNNLKENSGNQREIFLKNCCITGFLGSSQNDGLKQANKTTKNEH